MPYNVLCRRKKHFSLDIIINFVVTGLDQRLYITYLILTTIL